MNEATFWSGLSILGSATGIALAFMLPIWAAVPLAAMWGCAIGLNIAWRIAGRLVKPAHAGFPPSRPG